MDRKLKTLQLLIFGALTLRATEPAFAQRTYSAEEEQNKQIVLDFYEKALNQKDFASASKYLGAYTQHNPNVPDGPAGLQQYIEFLKKTSPQSHGEITQVFVDGEFVILRIHVVREQGSRGFATVDIFRVKNSLIQEHWDAVQPVPETSKNDNGMF